MKSFRQGIRAVSVIAVCALALASCSSGGETASVDPAEDNTQLVTGGELIVAMSGEFQPFSYVDGNQLTGFDYDIAVAIAEEMGLTLKTETAAVASLIQGLQSGRYDALIASLSPTEQRKAIVDFTDSYYSSGAQYFVVNDSDCEAFDIDSNSKVGVANGTTYSEYLTEQGFTGDVVVFESDSLALEDTETGRLDGTITDQLVGLYQIKKAERDMRPCGDPLYTEGPAIAVAKDNPLKNEINAALTAIKDEGTYAELSEKWFGQDIS